MKTETKNPELENQNDASLVNESLSGNVEAFGKIVGRYQRLLCSLAYSAIGSLNESEDLAQEAFIEAWKKLSNLREPEKLKSWLCGILKFKISHHRRKEARQPVRRADENQELELLESEAESITDSAIREEEQALLWRALEAVPKTYRETLILYYREHRSIEHVAFELDITEEAARQRLSRGRKILQEKTMAFVEGALANTAPDRNFTSEVMSVIIAIAPPIRAASAGVTAAKIGSFLKWSVISAFLASISGIISSFFAIRTNLEQSRTRRERSAIIRTSASFIGVAILFVVIMLGLRQTAVHGYGSASFLNLLAQGVVVAFVISYLLMTTRLLQYMRELRTNEKNRRPDLFKSPDDPPKSKKREYKSSIKLFGVPLFHFKLDMPEANEPPAVGWIAAGDKAYGLLFAWGGVVAAPVCVGIITFGLVSVGAVSFGVFSMGTVGIGILAMGASAIGYKAYASLSSLGWESAFSQGFSMAKEAAIGPIALAEQINNEAAGTIASLSAADKSQTFILILTALLVIVPAVAYSRAVRSKGIK